MIDAVDELMEYRKQNYDMNPILRRVHKFHRANPHVLDFLTLEMRVDRANGWRRTSLGSLWHYARWVLTRVDLAPGETFVMSNNLFPHYGRIICILHPELNGFFQMVTCQADADLGTRLDPAKSKEPGHARRLLWADGTELGAGWRPTIPHEPKPVKRRDRVKR